MLWTKSMEGGIPNIDAQHQELFRQVDQLLNSERQERVLETIRFLENYVVSHFATEEVLHRKIGYPQAALHHQQHVDFTNTFLALKREYEQSGYNLVTLLKINRVAVAWLKDHVMGADMDFAQYYHDDCQKREMDRQVAVGR